VLNAFVIGLTAAIAMVFVTVIVDIASFVHHSSDTEVVRINVGSKMMDTPFPSSFGATLEGIPGVKFVERTITLDGATDSGTFFFVGGEQETWANVVDPLFPITRADAAAWKAEKPSGAIVSERTAADLKLTVGQQVELPTSRGPLTIKVAAIAKGVKNPVIVTHYDYLVASSQDFANIGFRAYSTHADFPRIASEIAERTKNTETPAMAFTDAQAMESWVRNISTIPIIFGCLGAFLIATTILTLANHSAISMRERRIEIATLRVIGYKRRSIFALVIGEVLVVGLAGAALAALVILGLFPSGFQLSNDQTVLQSVKLGPLGIACGFAIALVVPLLGALPSAITTVRLRLVDSLRDSA
jgi:ABC-type antimicrobial peptide transport system permease subunit